MGTLYDELKAVASQMIGDFGKSVTITHVSEGTFNPETGVSSGAITSSQTINAVSLPASNSKIQALDLRYGLGGTTYEKLGFLMIAGQDITFEPVPGDTVAMDSVDWTVLGVTPTRPNTGNGIIYEVAIRI